MKITLDYNIRAIITHIDIDNGWLVIDLTNPIIWVDTAGAVKTVQTIFFGWDYLDDKDRIELKNLITNIVENGYSDEELLEIIPITGERIKRINPCIQYDNLKQLPDKVVQTEVLKAIKFAIVEKML